MKKLSRIVSVLHARAHHAYLGFRDDCKGVAALEFALIAPIMIMLFVGTLEVSAAVSVNRKISRISSVVGDLIAQSTTILTGSDIENIMDVASDIMRPYDVNTVKIRITTIDIDSSGVAKVDRSCNRGWSNLAKGEIYPVPSAIRTPDTSLVAAQVENSYQPMVGWARYSESAGISFDNTSVTMDEEIFLRPRIGSSIEIDNNPHCN